MGDAAFSMRGWASFGTYEATCILWRADYAGWSGWSR